MIEEHTGTLRQDDVNTREGNTSAARSHGIRIRPCASVFLSAVLPLILALALGLRLYRLDAESPWCDEVLTLAHLPAPSLNAFFHAAYTEDPVPQLAPLDYVLEYAWSTRAGASPGALRLLSVLLGLGTIGMIYLIGHRLYGSFAGLAAAWGLAVSLPHIYFSQEIRFYALFVLLASISLWGMIRGLQERDRWSWTAHLLSNALLLWTHTFAPLLLFAEGAFIAWFGLRHSGLRRTALWWAVIHALLLALFVGWALLVVRYDVGEHARVLNAVPATWRDAANVLLVFAGGRFAKEDPRPYLPCGISLDRAILILLCVMTVGLAIREMRGAGDREPSRTGWRDRDSLMLLAIWLTVPLASLYAIASFWRPCFLHRYVLYSLLACPLLMSGALIRLPGRPLRIAAALALVLAYGYQNLALPRPFRADYQAAARAIDTDAGPRTRVNALKAFNAKGMQYSLPWPGERLRTYEGFRELCADTASEAAAGNTVWAVFYRWDRTAEFEAAIRTQGLRCVRYILGGMPPLIAYRITQTTAQASP